jgi:indole-3-glycerol phosphate synthase
MMPTFDLEYSVPAELRGTILDQIIQARIPEIVGAKSKWPAEAIVGALDRAPQVRSLKAALSRGSPAVIAELKKASPSAGLLRRDFDPAALAHDFEEGGASALSVVTEGKHFQGRLETLASLRWSTRIPLLRKDFVIDPYQVLEARHAGADAVLLIAALLESEALRSLRADIERLGMDALVEVHNGAELRRAIDAGATLIGVNNRDLRTFEVSLETCLTLAPSLPKNVVAVAESGIRSSEDIRRLWDAGFRGFLVGEQLMRAASPAAALSALIPGKRKARSIS